MQLYQCIYKIVKSLHEVNLEFWNKEERYIHSGVHSLLVVADTTAITSVLAQRNERYEVTSDVTRVTARK